LANILIVEDDRDIAEVLADTLAGEGHRTRTAADGFQGLRCVADEVPDVILLDLEMPILDGLGMLRALSIQYEGRARIPVALISASHRLPSIARQLGMPYLQKPLRLAEVIRLTTQMLEAPR
jgi:CheY-like chemotaxis protein